MSQPIYVLYHAHCADGFCAAWVCWRQFKDQAQYIPCSYGQPLPEIPDGARVYMVDFSYDRATIEALAARTELTILDHHKSAEAALAGLPYAFFDQTRSGASLAWKHLFPFAHTPKMVQYVEDRDLWKWALPGSREISAVIALLEPDFEEWEKMHQLVETRTQDLIERGQVLLLQQAQAVQRQASQSFLCEVPGHGQVAFASAAAYQSELGEELLRLYPVATFACCFVVGHDSIRCSLRSRGDVDVAAVAQTYGGGGHKSAAGFHLKAPYNRFMPFLTQFCLPEIQEETAHAG